MTNRKKRRGAQSSNYLMFGMIILLVFGAVYFVSTYDWPSHDPEKLVGTWVYNPSSASMKQGDSFYTVGATRFVFAANGGAEMIGNDVSSAGTYSVDGEKLTLQFSGAPEVFDFVIRGDALKLSSGEGDEGATFTRYKD